MVNWHLLVVDIQEGFAPHIHGWDAVVSRCEILLAAARRLGVALTASEQNPAKLGATVPAIKKHLDGIAIHPKLAFSSLRVPEIRACLVAQAPVNLILIGIEAHVCILGTALDALRMDGVKPYLPVDAISSRRELDRDTAFRRLSAEGAALTTVESVIFEILGEAGTDRFRSVLPLVR